MNAMHDTELSEDSIFEVLTDSTLSELRETLELLVAEAEGRIVVPINVEE